MERESSKELVQATSVGRGRPPKYKRAYCDEVIELGKLGKSQVQIACAVGVDPKSLRDWAAVHNEFSLALTRAKAEEQNWWETVGQNALTADKFNSAVWSKSMSARFRNEYSESRRFPPVGPTVEEALLRSVDLTRATDEQFAILTQAVQILERLADMPPAGALTSVQT